MVRPSTPPPQANSQPVNVSPPTPEVTRKLVGFRTTTHTFFFNPDPISNRKNPASAQKTSAHKEKPPPAHPAPSGPSPSHPRASSTQRTSTLSHQETTDPSASGRMSPSHNPTYQKPTEMRGHRRKGKMSAASAVVEGAGAMGRVPSRAR